MREPAELGRDALEPHPLIRGAQDDRTLTESLFRPVWQATPRGFWALLALGLLGMGLLAVSTAVTFAYGIGAWGNDIPVAWAFAITNFVWWIGIGHAGTLISAILLLLQQRWRTSINRFAEAMTLFAVLCAALFPLLHLGRPWFFYWLIPYPSTMGVWPQFRSPLVWDVFAIATYFTVSFLFWYVGLLPDLAALREASRSKARRVIYGIFSLGWKGSGRHWHHYRMAYLLLAGLATPLVLSVHTVVSFDFAVAQLPGWHSTVFPPYFVAGAIFSGFAMVMTLMVPARKLLGLEHVITLRHLENMNKVILATGWMVTYGYVMEVFLAYYSGHDAEVFMMENRMTGPYAPVFWLMVACNVLLPQVFWLRRARVSLVGMWVVSILINVGMWSERFIIIVTSLHRDFLPSSWGIYTPTWVDWGLLAGSLGLFFTAFLLFLRLIPPVAVSEVKELNEELRSEGRA